MTNKKPKTESESLKPGPYRVTPAQAKYIAAALGTDPGRDVLRSAAIVAFDGALCLISTDTHRLHLVKLGPLESASSKSERFGGSASLLLDIRRCLHEAKFYSGFSGILIDVDFSEARIELHGGGKKSRTEQIYAPVIKLSDPGSPFPNWEKVIPQTTRPVQELFGINLKYLSDALGMARQCANRVVMYSEDAINKPIVFTGESRDWMSVVMPMSTSRDSWIVQASRQVKRKSSASEVAG